MEYNALTVNLNGTIDQYFGFAFVLKSTDGSITTAFSINHHDISNKYSVGGLYEASGTVNKYHVCVVSGTTSEKSLTAMSQYTYSKICAVYGFKL